MGPPPGFRHTSASSELTFQFPRSRLLDRHNFRIVCHTAGGLRPQPDWASSIDTNHRNPTEQLPRLLKHGSQGTIPQCALRCCCFFLNCLCGRTDYIDHQVGVGEHWHVAAVDLVSGGAHTLREEALQVRMNGAVVLGDDVPARLRFPGSFSSLRIEQVGSRHALGRPNQLLFLLGQIAGETVDAFRKQPDTSVRDFISCIYFDRLRRLAGEPAYCHTVTTFRGASRAPRATVSQSRFPVGVRGPTNFGFAAALQATSTRSQKK